MRKISINNVIKFKNKKEGRQKQFLNKIFDEPKNKNENESGGGNYWVRSLSALSNCVKSKNTAPISEKIRDIENLFNPSLSKQTKNMYERNLNVLYNYEDFDFGNWLPENYEVLSKTKKKSIIEIKKVPLQITPSQVFTFIKDDEKYVGAVWFVSKLEGYSDQELGMFAESLFIYLSHNFNKDYKISAEHCIVVDALENKEINYQKLIDGDILSILKPTLLSIRDI